MKKNKTHPKIKLGYLTARGLRYGIKDAKTFTRFAKLIHELARIHSLKIKCREIGLPLTPDDPQFSKEQKQKWADAKSYTTKKHRYKVRQLVKFYAHDQFGV